MNTQPRLRVLLTGGAGMVGRNIAEHAVARTWELIAPPRAELDLERFDAVQAFMHEVRPQVVIHAAGLVGGIQANLARPVDFLVRNVDLGRNVILAAHAAGVPQLINLGSSCMYPRNGNNPLREEQVLDGELEPTNEGYAIAKIYAAADLGFKARCARLADGLVVHPKAQRTDTDRYGRRHKLRV